MTPEDVVRRARAGDPVAFETIVRDWSGPIRRLALRMTGDTAAADEVVQETFVRAHAAIAEFRGEASIGTWLYRIAANLCYARSAERGRSSPIEEVAPLLPDGAPGPAALAEGREIGRRIAAAVAALPPRQRAVFVLREFENLAHAEIAAALGMAENTAKVTYLHAVRNLRRMLEDLR